MTTLTVGANDTADNTGDLIVSFVDSTPPGVTTDGTRTALPGAPWGCYLIAPSISPQGGCVVTFSPTTAQWESCSLIWQPPPHAAILWTSGGAFTGSGGAAANPKFPPQNFSGAGEIDATANVSGRIAALDALGASVGASAGISGRLRILALSGATLAGAGSIKGVPTGPGATQWQEAGIVNGSAAISSRQRLAVAAGGLAAGSAGISGNAARSPQQYAIAGEIDGTAGISSSAWVGHQYFVAGKPAGSAAITFSPTTPLRVTNWVRNPRPEGVTLGVCTYPSNVGPTDWYLLFSNPDSMLTVTMIGTGTEGIIPYVDIQWSNASCPGGFMTVQTESGTPVSSGVVWSYSVFCRLVGGSLTNISSIGLQILTDGTTGFFNGPTFTPTSASLASQWSHWDGVNITDTGMTNIAAGLVINANAGAVDMTLRIGAPKAEKASAASGSQFQAIPQIGFVSTTFGGSSSFVY